jgi:murein DD-endopeptidase MepM/ murein hydrolase activator NlpD
MMKHSTDLLREEYSRLEARYDSLRLVAENITERDRNIFRILFESDPYSLDEELRTEQLSRYEELQGESTYRLKRELGERTYEMEQRLSELEKSYDKIEQQIDSLGDMCNHIPAIQPVINPQLSLLTASYGMRIHPFYKTLQAHQGVDYAVPEGSRVFATADGRVKDVSRRNSTSGQTVILDHGNGYETSYSHLVDIRVKKGAQVKRGDIIASSGNSGLSFVPHLHYEVIYRDTRVDPVHYFFMELTPEEYQRIIRIAQSGMQSFD